MTTTTSSTVARSTSNHHPVGTPRLSAQRRGTLARYAQEAGYRVDRVREGRSISYRIWVAGQTLTYASVGRPESGTPCWAHLSTQGLHLAGPGYSSGKWYPSTLAGLERLRADYLCDHLATICGDDTLHRHADGLATPWASGVLTIAYDTALAFSGR